MLNRAGHSIYPWGTLLITGLQLDFALPITTPWGRPFRQFSVHLTCVLIQPMLQQLVCEDLMGDSVKSVKSLTEVQVDNFPLIHQVCDFIIEAYQGSQA